MKYEISVCSAQLVFHSTYQHEERRLIWCEAFVEEKFQPVIDQGHIQEDAIARQTVPTMSNNLSTALRVIAGQPCQHTVMWNGIRLELRFPVLRRPCLDDGIVVLVIADGYLRADVVSDGLGLRIELDELLGSLSLLLLLVLF
jgi:hypothetical protein